MTEAAASEPSGGRVGGLALSGPVRLLSDERLSRRATSGDRRAFEEIFRRYHQDLYRFCLATVSNPQDAQEALQNTMVKVMRALPGEEREIKLKPWLYRIARNEAVETIRKRRPGVELNAERLQAPWEIADTATARERLRNLLADLAKLPERQRSALVMRELAGLDFAEIGEAFGTTAAVARQTLYEARQSLRQMEEGREMSCDAVRQAISDADGRVTRRRDLRAHVRSCAGCRAFGDDIARRRGELAAIAPLPLAASAGIVNGLLGGQAAAAGAAGAAGGAGAAGAGGLVGTIGAGAGKALVTSAVVKSAATVAVVAAVGVSADRSGVVDLPYPGENDNAAKRGAGAGAARHGRANAGPQSRAVSGGGEPTNAAGRQSGSKGGSPSGGAPNRVAGPSGGAVGPAKGPRPAHGRSAAGGRGHGAHGAPAAGGGRGPQGTPPSSSRGQQTAAERKAPAPAPASPAPKPSAPPSGGKPAVPVQPTPPATESAPTEPAPEAAPSAPSAPGKGASAAAGAGSPPVPPSEP